MSRAKNRKYNVAIFEGSVKRTNDAAAWRTLVYKRVVLANSRTAAIEKCLPEIRKNVLSKITDETIRFVSVFCGVKGSVSGAAERLTPIQITRDGEIRERLR